MAGNITREKLQVDVVINGNEAQADLYKLEKRNRELSASTKALTLERDKLGKKTAKNAKEWDALSQKISANNKEVKENRTEMRRLQDEIGITGLTLRQLGQRASFLKLQLANMLPKDPRRAAFKQELKEIGIQMDKLKFKASSAKSSLSKVADGFNKYAALGASVIAMGTGIVLSMQKMIDYNGKLSDSQADVRKTTGLTTKEVDELTKSFGMLKTRTARIELLKLAEEGGRLGIEGVKNIKDFVEVANQLKVALGDDLGDEQIREVGKMVNVYKVGEKTGRDFKNSMLSLGSAINEVSASGANQAGYLVDYLKRQAGIAVQAKVSAEDNLAYAATFDEIGQSVEISATAMNKVWMDMFTNTGEYAKIAGMDLKSFTNLLNTDANGAMIKFLKGLNGNNEGLAVMLDKLKDLEAGGARGVQALSALAGNTELLEERQKQSNKALIEATSLTDEYNLKNNNLAGTLDKVKKKLLGAFSSQALTATLTGIVTLFGKMIGAIDNVNAKFEEETKITYENVKANRQLVNESQALLDEYMTLTKDGIEPTIEEKERLEIITLQLKDRLGESVMAIDTETGAYILNTEAVKQQIKIKRLAADEEAATLVSRRRGVQDAIKEQEDQLSLAEKEYNLRKKIFEDKNADDIAAINNARDLNAMEKQAMLERLDGYNEFDKARLKTGQINQQIYEDNKKLADLNAKLKDLNYTEADADAFFAENPTPPIPPVPPIPPLPPCPPGDKGDPVKEARKRAEELLNLIREAEDRKLDIMTDGFNKQMLLEDFNHYRKIEDLQNKLVSQEQIAKTTDANLKASYIASNEALNSQIESELELHEIRKGTILEKGYANDIKQSQEAYNREKVVRETAHLEQLNGITTLQEAKALLKDSLSAKELKEITTLDQAKKALQDQFDAEELDKQKEHLDKLVAQLQEFMSSGQFEGFDMSLLTPDQQAEFESQVDALKLKIQELIAAKKGLSGEGSEEEEGKIDLGDAGNMDVLGFTADQWLETFSNLKTLEGKIAAASMGVQGFMNAWSMYHEMVSANERKELATFERNTNRKKEKQKNLLDSGLINQRQYDAAIKALEIEADKRKAEMEYKQAKRAWKMQLTQAIANTAMAVLNGLQATPFLPVGIAMGALAGILGGIQIATIAKNKPVKGYEKGKYPVTRQQDGKQFNATYGGESRSGLVDEPTVFLAGEAGKNSPELIINGEDLKQFHPDLKNSLYREIGRVRGYEDGYYQSRTPEPDFNNPSSSSPDTATYAMLTDALNRNSNILEKLETNGVPAYMDKNMRNIKKLREEFERLEKIENKRKPN